MDSATFRRSAGAILAHDFVKRQATVEHFGGGFGEFQAPFVGQLPQAEMDRFGQADYPGDGFKGDFALVDAVLPVSTQRLPNPSVGDRRFDCKQVRSGI